MDAFIDTLFGVDAPDFWRGVLPLLVVIAAIPFLTRRIKHPKRPEPDPLKGVEFDENGAVRKKNV